ncbi:MAG: DUF481 domain-containing protein [Candidatus Hydrogenedentota bacterium]
MVLFVAVLFTTAAGADVLTLRSGDLLSGTLNNIRNGTLSFRSKVAGLVFVPVKEVQSISTDSFVIVDLDGEKLLPGRLRQRDGATYLSFDDAADERLIDLGKVKGVTAVPAAEKSEDAIGGGTEVSVETGYKFRTGTQGASGPFVDVEIKHDGEQLRVEGDVEAEALGDGAELGRFVEGGVSGTFDLGAAWHPRIALEMERDRDKALDYRADVVAGVETDVRKDERQVLSAVAGVVGTAERFDAGPLRRDLGRDGRSLAGTDAVWDTDLGLHLQLDYSRLLWGDAELQESLVLRPSLTDLGDLRARYNASIQVPISPRLKLNLDLRLDYEDGLPYRQLDEWRTTVGAGVRVKF